MGELKEAQKSEGVLTKTHIGGQALIEGVMMRGRFNWAVAVRQPDGRIYTESHDLASGKKKNKWMYWPVIRGCTALVESLALGYKALDIAGNHAFDFSDEGEEILRCAQNDGVSDAQSDEGRPAFDEESRARPDERRPSEGVASCGFEAEEGAAETLARPDCASAKRGSPEADEIADEKDDDEDGLPAGLMTFSMILGLVLGIALFIVVPALLTNLIMGDYGQRTLAWNLVDGLIRVAIFIGYIWLISRMKDIKRMFSYHGAEHKTIHCYEHGLELSPRNAQQFPRLHVRCGTAFMIMTMIIAILVFTVVPVNQIIVALGVGEGPLKLVLVIASRIVLLPLVAGLTYELTVKWAGAHPENPLVKVVLWPGMQMQRLTTNPPDDSMLECAIAAMKLVLERERQEALAGNEAAVMPLEPAGQGAA